MPKSVFEKFTGKYSLSKTLRFELVPVGKTQNSLRGVFEEDKRIKEAYQKAKAKFDELHRMFVHEALSLSRVQGLDLSDFTFTYNTLIGIPKKEQTKDQKNAYQKERKSLLRKITNFFDETGDEWKMQYEKMESVGRSGKQKMIKFSSNGHEILTDEAVLNILIKKFPEDTEIFSTFFGFFTYFGKFNETRENFYKNDGTSTAVATRIVENIEKFLRNKRIVETEYTKAKSDIKLTNEEIEMLTDIEKNKDLFLQAGIDTYNTLLGGSTELEQSVNKKVNEYRQRTGDKVSFLAKLHNQILSEKDAYEMLVIENDTDLAVQLKTFASENMAYCAKMTAMIGDILVDKENNSFDWAKVYLSSGAINTISSKYFTDWSILKGALLDVVGIVKSEGKELPDFISLQQVYAALEVNDTNKLKKSNELFRPDILAHKSFDSDLGHFTNLVAVLVSELGARVTASEVALNELENGSFWRTEQLSQKRTEKEDEGTVQISQITKYLNACRDAHRMIKYFATEYRREWKEPEEGSDPRFYDAYREEYEKDIFFPLYNAARNFLTQKPSDENKVKLNFECGQLLSGWDKNKEQEKLGVILRKDGTYYLSIMRKQFSDMFDEEEYPEAYQTMNVGYEKMEYKLFPDPKRMIPKVAFADKNKKAFGWTPEIQVIKDEYAAFQELKKEDQSTWKNHFDKDKTSKLIAYYQNCLVKGGYQETFDLTWKKPEEYSGIGEFNDHISQQNYKVKFVSVSSAYVDERVEKGEMYLFKIKSKDFAEGATGAKNIHSLYFLQLFAGANLDHSPVAIQLAGAGEIFYREASIAEKTSIITKEKKHEITKADGDVYHFKRFAEDKIFFHMSIKINPGAETVRSQYQFNKTVNTELIAPHANELCVIGIDRGEKHLAYYSVVNTKGEIIEEGSFNTVNGIEYHHLLNEREKERKANRQSWLPARQIKDLKKGFVGHAVKQIVDLAIKHNAIIVLEDLNMRFKQIRSGIEKSAYQQLEKALIDKLGYLVLKSAQDDAVGGVLRGYQLAAPFESFKDMGKQTGIVFYTEAAYTSTTDPVTGFRKNVYISNSAPQDKIVRFIERCDAIGWDGGKKSYFFTYNPTNLIEKKEKNVVHAKTWTVYANVPRIRRERDEHGIWNATAINPNDLLQELFKKWGFADIYSPDMRGSILTKHKDGELKGKRGEKNDERTFYNAFTYAFNFILLLRNSDTNSEQDFIASPVEPFFSTQDAPDPNSCGTKLKNGDSLGAYNIARKGLITINRIKENPEKPDLYISKEQWDEWASRKI